MDKFYKDKYNEMKNSHPDLESDVDTDIDTDSMKKVLSELGIGMASDDECSLILWNDHVNDMMSVVVALYEVCKLTPEECTKVMLEAHTKGRAVVKTGSYDELSVMKTGLNDRNLEVTIENN